MKNCFKLMSLMLGLLMCSQVFVACGDDDEDDKNPTGGDTSIKAEQLYGCWCAVDENTAEKVNVFCVYLEPDNRGYYVEFKAKAKNNWEVEDESVDIKWSLSNGKLTMIAEYEGERMERSADLLKLDGNSLTIKRYLGEGKTDQVTMARAESPQEARQILWQLVEQKMGK